MTRLAIIGSRDLGQLIAHHASITSFFDVVGFFDDSRDQGELTQHGPVLGKVSDIEKLYSEGRFDEFIMAVGYSHLEYRMECYSRIRQIVQPATLIHPSCYVDPSARIGEGCFLLPGCVIDAGAVIGENTLLNTSCSIAHDTTVGSHCFLGPGVNLTGFITVGSSCFLGAGTIAIEKIAIAAGVQTGAGAVITKSLDEKGLYVGVPAVKIR